MLLTHPHSTLQSDFTLTRGCLACEFLPTICWMKPRARCPDLPRAL
jgi:hypothetical protein